jgi:hypothetical protein
MSGISCEGLRRWSIVERRNNYFLSAGDRVSKPRKLLRQISLPLFLAVALAEHKTTYALVLLVIVKT